MKLICLNTWGGKIYKPLIDFIKGNLNDTDIFCFQEVFNTKSNVKQHNGIRANLLGELIKLLPNFQFYYSVEISGFDDEAVPVDFDLTVGKAIFVKNTIKINDTGNLLIYKDPSQKFLKKDFSNLPVTLLYITLTISNKLLIICNIHGTAFPGSKLDTKLRLEHSRRIKEFLQTKKGAKIIAGDFNLLPKTQSIRIFEDNMINLIKKFNIKRTRSNLSPYFGKTSFQKFADYIFVSKDIIVKTFQVSHMEISDHLPLILEFE